MMPSLNNLFDDKRMTLAAVYICFVMILMRVSCITGSAPQTFT
jgi:hypothetical protein